MLKLMQSENNSNMPAADTPKIDNVSSSEHVVSSDDTMVIRPDTSPNPQASQVEDSISSSDTTSDNSAVSASPKPMEEVDSVSAAEIKPSPSLNLSDDNADMATGDAPNTPNDVITPSEPPAKASDKPAKSGNSLLKIMVIFFVVLILLGATSVVSYAIGKRHHPATVVGAPKPINLPSEAIVTADCVIGRGKQYIIPKNIPVGPIYDVENSKVIAIEYVLGLRAVATNSDQFSDTLLRLTRDYPVDHFSIVPEQPKPGDTDQFIHLIMFIVSKDEANRITCGGKSPATTTPQSTTTNTTTTSSTPTANSTTKH